ncbi:hypothetical protein [Chamaesiphon sp. VAR_48_metabat_135_sub]|uniref:hypothetical protein n=1 Tax=Chamaesiphon sp. VAR_48_metabat_135_sub TaxID=2964699 RepID=UPI00286B23E6|nr:hypothetical protein [Chamaesiphon sp. VAR_48_metabat_135_sub]
MNELFYPTIDLFIYDLRSPLNADATEIASNLQAFRSRLPPKIELKNPQAETEYLALATPTRLKLDPVDRRLGGYYYPVLLNDTYGLQIDCSVENFTEPQSLDSFSSIESEIEDAACNNPLTIGKTWLLSGWSIDRERDAESIAIECYQTLFKDKSTPRIYGKGTLLSADIFEIWQPQSYKGNHSIVIIFPDRETLTQAAEFYTDWMGLYCYRHKITWAYHQSRSIKEALIEHYKKVQDNAEIIKNSQKSKISLADLQKIFNDVQNILNKYTIDLLNLSFQKQIIDINLVNYRTRLEQIEQKAGSASNLDFLDRFSNLAEKKYLAQIEKDADNMQLGLKLLETNINALRSQIELEKSERDLNFQNLVTIVGAGTALTTVLDYEGKKCKAIIGDTNPYCKNFGIGGVLIPIGLLLILGAIMLFSKWLYIKIKMNSQK